MFRKSLGPGTDSGLQLPRVAAYQRCLTTCGENARLAPGRDRSQDPHHALLPGRGARSAAEKPPRASGIGVRQGLRDGGTLATLRSLFFSP